MNKKLIALIAALILIPGCGIGCIGAAGIGVYLLSTGGGTMTPQPANEDSFWDSLADDLQDYPKGYPDTEVLLKTAEGAVNRGLVPNMDRLDSLKRNEIITDANRDDLIRVVRGN